MEREQKKFFKKLMKLCGKYSVYFESETEYMNFVFESGDEIMVNNVTSDVVGYSTEENLWLED